MSTSDQYIHCIYNKRKAGCWASYTDAHGARQLDPFSYTIIIIIIIIKSFTQKFSSAALFMSYQSTSTTYIFKPFFDIEKKNVTRKRIAHTMVIRYPLWRYPIIILIYFI